MSYFGRVENGVVVLETGSIMPEGIRVRVEPVDSVEPKGTLAEKLLDWAGGGVDLPSDLARRHDEYLHHRDRP